MAFRHINRVVSTITLIVFLFTNILYAAPDLHETLRVPLGFAKEQLLEQEQTGLSTKEMLLMMAQAVAMRMDDESRLKDLGTTFFNTAFRKNLDSPIEIRMNETTGTVHIRYNGQYLSITKKRNIASSNSRNFNKAGLELANIEPLASSSSPSAKQDTTIGSLLGLMETFADLGLKRGDRITINDIVPERKRQDGTLYSRRTVSNEFEDAVALELLRPTGNKIARSNEYEVLKAFTRKQLNRLPEYIREKLNRGRIRSDEIEEIRGVFTDEALMGPGALLKVFLAGLAGFQEVFAAIPSTLTGVNSETVNSFFEAVEQVARLTRDFENNESSYKPLV